MASSQFIAPTSFPSSEWNTWDGDDILNRGRGRSTFVSNQEQMRQSRPRPRSADARPQYHDSRSTNRRQEYWNSIQMAEKSQYDNPSMRYPSNLPSPTLVYQSDGNDWGRGGYTSQPQTNYNMSNEVVMIPGDPYNATTRIVSPDNQYASSHFNSRQASRNEIRFHHEQQRQQQAMPQEPSATFPRTNNPGRNMQNFHSSSFPNELEANNNQGEKSRRGWRGSMMKSAMAQKLKGNKSSAAAATTTDSPSKGRKSWNIIPALSRSRSLSPSCSSRASDSSNERRNRRSKKSSKKKKSKSKGHFPSNDAVYNDGAQYFPDQLSHPLSPGSSQSASTISSKEQRRNYQQHVGGGYYNSGPMNTRQPYEGTRDFNGGYNFDEQGFSNPQIQHNVHDQSENFKLIRSNQYSQALQTQGDDRRNSNTYSRFMAINNTIGLIPRADDFRSAPNINNTMGFIPPPTKEYGTPPKVSPTSVMDLNNTNNVRWSDNLSQSPTNGIERAYNPSNRRAQEERPKSILRSGRLNVSGSSDDNRNKVITQFDPFGSPGSIDFVDKNGRSLSPIRMGSPLAATTTGKTRTMYEESSRTRWKNNSSSGFEKNIPSEYHRFFLEKQQATMRKDDSDMISDAYNEFIESVASVVVQTAARRFLARIKVERRRAEMAAARKYRFNRRRIEGRGNAPTPRNSTDQSTRSWSSSSRQNLSSARNQKELFHLAAVRIQSIFRGWWARDSLKVDHYCACVIQKNFRAYFYRNYYLYNLYRIVVAQSVVRGYLLRKSLGFQSFYSSDLNNEEIAATKIQAQWRSFSCEMKFLRTYGDILIIQSLIRGWITRRQVRPLLARNKSNGWGQNHGSRRRLAHLQHKSLSSGGYNRNQTHYNPSTSYGTSWRGGVNTQAAVNTTHQASDYQYSHQDNLSDVDRRRKESERKRQAMMEEEKRRQEREAAHAADMLAVQRRMEMKSQANKKGFVKQTFSDDTDRSESLLFNHAGQVIRRSQDGNNSTEQVIVGPSNSYDSDKETEIQSNLRSSTSTIRVLDGWRNRGQKSGGAPNDDAATNRESSESVAVTGRRTFTSKSSPRKSGSAFHEEMRARRSNEEQFRIDGMHKIWQHVGLMKIAVENQRVVGESFGSKKQTNAHEPKKVVSNFKIENRVNPPAKVAPQRQSFPFTQPPRGAELKTERRLFSDQQDGDTEKEVASSRSRGLSYPFTNKDKDNVRSKRLMEAFGLDASGDDSDDDSTDSEEEKKEEEEPDFMQHFSMARRGPHGNAGSLAHNQSVEVKTSYSSVRSHPPKSKEVSSIFQVQMKSVRSKEEQLRIDTMHEIFSRVGLMDRKMGNSSDNGASVGTTDSTKQYTSPKVHVDYSEPSAADLLKSWRNRDQTQPTLKGKLF